jgi:hypothetical protein
MLLVGCSLVPLGMLQGCRQSLSVNLSGAPTTRNAAARRPTISATAPPTATPAPAPTETPVPSVPERIEAFLETAQFTYLYQSPQGGGALYSARYKSDVLDRLGLSVDVNGTGERSGVVLKTLNFYEFPPWGTDDAELPESWHPTSVVEPGTVVTWSAEITMRDVTTKEGVGVIIARPAETWSRYKFEFARLAWFPDDVYIKPR